MNKKQKNNLPEHIKRNILRGLLSLIPIILVFKVAELTYVAIDKNVMVYDSEADLFFQE